MQHLPLDGLVFTNVDEASRAIRHEIDAAASTSADLLELSSGRVVGNVGGDQIWSFVFDGDSAPEPETPGQLWIADSEPAPVRVLAVSDASLVLSTTGDLGDDAESAKLSLDSAFVYQKLLERLDGLIGSSDADDSLLCQLLIPDVYDPGPDDSDGGARTERPDPNDDQRRAAALAIEPGVRFTWGPPGTGKTKVLAMAAAQAAQRGDRVLVVAHANAAVDVAIARIADELADHQLLTDGRVLRVGIPQDRSVLARSEILPDHLAELRHPEVAARLPQLAGRRRELSDLMRSESDSGRREELAKQLDAVRTETRELRHELRAVSDEIIGGAAIVATTLSRAVIDERLWSNATDVVIVDEASMAPQPFILALTLRGAETLSIFGDFRQLAPICVSTAAIAQEWFAKDVFQHAGVVEAHERGLVDPRVTSLRTQFRMGEQICETVNQLAYGGLLRTDSGARDRAIRLAEIEPGPGAEVVVVDTGALGAVCSVDAQPDSYSRVNVLSAALAASIAQSLLASGCDTVGVISPYRAQADLIRALVPLGGGIDVATIHRFQGSERDAIVFDLTDGLDFRGPSKLTGADADQALRLFNVAVSRARGKLVVLADLEFVHREFPRGSVFLDLLEHMSNAGGEVVNAPELIDDEGSDELVSPVLRWAPSWAAAMAHLSPGGDSGIYPAALEINLPGDEFAGNWVEAAVAAGADQSSVTVRCSPALAPSLEHTGADIRLLLASASPWVVAGDDRLIVGSRDPLGPAIVAVGPRSVTAFRRVVVPTDRSARGFPHP